MSTRIKRCPQCNAHIRLLPKPNDHHLIDSMRRECPSCGHRFFDPAFNEYAISYYLSPGIFLKPLPLTYFAVTMIVGLVSTILIDVPRAIQSQLPADIANAVILLLFFGGLSFYFGRPAIKAIYRKVCKNRYMEKFQATKMDVLRGYREPERAHAKYLKPSMERMKDREYIYFLLENNVNVPEFFRERVGIFPDDNRLQAILQRLIFQERAEEMFARIQDYEREIEYYQDFLDMGPKSQTFLYTAKEHHLTPAQFEALCTRRITELKTRINQEVTSFNLE